MNGWGRLSAAQLAVGLVTVLLALFVAIFAYFVLDGVRQTQRDFEERSAAAAQVVATNAYWITEVANQTLRRVDAALGPALLGDAADLAPAMEALPTLSEVYIIDENAQTIFSTVPGASAVSVADREYFTALKAGAQFYTSALLTSRLTGDHIFVFSKPITRNGRFAGAIMISFPEAVLDDLYHTLDLDEGSTISLVRADGQLMARFPPTTGPVDLSALPLFTDYLLKSDTGTYSSERSPVDGLARVVSYRAVAGTEIVALASVSTDARWAEFRAAIVAVIIIVSPVIIGLVLGCWWIIRLNGRDRRRAEELASQASELRASVELNTLLFREIHHRVKNNLQSVQALVRMQDIPESAKRDLQSRLAAMAAMHEHIYQNDRYVDIDAHDFVPAVVDEVVAAYGVPIELRYQVDHIDVDRDHATPLALLLSELVTNACKYAFADGRAAMIAVTLQRRENGRSTLILRDNGVGLAADGARPRSMGMRLIAGIVGQMDGRFDFSNDGGAVFTADLALSASVRQ